MDSSVLNDFPLRAPSCEMTLDEDDDDDSIPWLNFPIVEPFNDDTCSGFLPQQGNNNSLASMEQRSRSSAFAPNMQQDRTSKLLSSVTDLTKHGASGNSPLMLRQHLFSRRGNSDVTHSDAGHMDLRNPGSGSSPAGGSMRSKLHGLDAGQPSNSSAVTNFPHLSRFAPLCGVNVRNTSTVAGAVVSGRQRACSKNSPNPAEPTLVHSPHQEAASLPPQQSEDACVKAGENDHPSDAVPTQVMVGDERIPEPAVATSSVCSGNNRLDTTSNDPARSLKRKCHETADSDGPSDEAADESFSDRKIASGPTSSKRSRVAEVHNLSERRRRERINEKMRALQELIPNCNKADKASMLDEAIDYLKTLQLQVQIMSIGAGMYMPPMMFPAAIQNMHRAHMPQLWPMGMHDVNYIMTQMPNIQGPCYPVQGPPNPNSRTSTFHSHQFLGRPGVPPPLFGSSPMSLPLGNVSTMPGILDLPLLAPSATSHEMVQAKCSMDQDSDQATNLLNGQYRDVSANEAEPS